ncbi:MAG: hypothetical protein ACLRO1_12410 [Agathobaculum sp.]
MRCSSRNLSARQWDRPGTLGINMDAATEYKIMVDKDDYDEACYVAIKKG